MLSKLTYEKSTAQLRCTGRGVLVVVWVTSMFRDSLLLLLTVIPFSVEAVQHFCWIISTNTSEAPVLYGYVDVGTSRKRHYHAGQNDYLPFFFFEGLITEFGNNYRNRFFSLRAYF